MNVYLNIGTNLGDRVANIERAISEIEAAFGCTALRSDIVESEPWGFSSPNMFLNIGVLVRSSLAPEDILDTVKRIERKISPLSHRNPDGSYADRIVDIDIMDIEGVELDSPALTVPHRHLHDRDFFLVPYNQLRALAATGDAHKLNL